MQVRYVGRVQGVGFRATCRWIAQTHPVTGWVRNEPDGTVLLEAQGAGAEVERFLQAIDARLGENIRNRTRSALPTLAGESDFMIAR